MRRFYLTGLQEVGECFRRGLEPLPDHYPCGTNSVKHTDGGLEDVRAFQVMCSTIHNMNVILGLFYEIASSTLEAQTASLSCQDFCQ